VTCGKINVSILEDVNVLHSTILLLYLFLCNAGGYIEDFNVYGIWGGNIPLLSPRAF